MKAKLHLNEKLAAAKLAALGNETRLLVFKSLVRAGHDGLNVGEIQRLLHIPASTLAHHLATLCRAELVQQSHQGREVRCHIDFNTMNSLVAYLSEQCCTGIDLETSSRVA